MRIFYCEGCQCPVNSVYTLPEAQTTLVKSSSYRRYRHPKRLSVAPACILALLLWVNVSGQSWVHQSSGLPTLPTLLLMSFFWHPADNILEQRLTYFMPGWPVLPLESLFQVKTRNMNHCGLYSCVSHCRLCYTLCCVSFGLSCASVYDTVCAVACVNVC